MAAIIGIFIENDETVLPAGEDEIAAIPFSAVAIAKNTALFSFAGDEFHSPRGEDDFHCSGGRYLSPPEPPI